MDRFNPGDKVRVTGPDAHRFPNGTTVVVRDAGDYVWIVTHSNHVLSHLRYENAWVVECDEDVSSYWPDENAWVVECDGGWLDSDGRRCWVIYESDLQPTIEREGE